MLTEEQIGALAVKADESVDFREFIGGIFGIIVEKFDKAVFKSAIRVVDMKLLDKVPDHLHSMVNDIVDALMSEDWDLALEYIADLIFEYLDAKKEASQ